MAEEEIIPEVEQHPPQLLQKKQQQQQQQQIKDDKKEKVKTTLSKSDKELLGKFEKKYDFDWKDKRAGYVNTVVGNDIIFIRRIPNKAKGYAKYSKSGQYLILKTNKDNFEKFINNEIAEGFKNDDEEIDDIKFEYFNFSKDYFDKNEKTFADSLKQKKFLFNDLDKEKKEVQYLDWNDFKDLDIIPSISNEEKYIEILKKFDVEKIKKNNFGEKEFIDEKDLFGIADEEPIEEKKEDAAKQRLGFDEDEETLPKKEDVKIEDDIDNSDSEGMTDTEEDIQEINVQDLQRQQQQHQQQQQLVAQNNQLIAGHTPNGEELRALIKYNNNSDSLLKLIVSLSENNKGEVDFKEIGEIQDLNGDITNLYSDMQDLKSKINSSNNAEAKEKLLIKYNKKRLKLEDLVKKYSKEAYRLSTLNKKHKATYSNPNYIKNKLNKLK